MSRIYSKRALVASGMSETWSLIAAIRKRSAALLGISCCNPKTWLPEADSLAES